MKMVWPDENVVLLKLYWPTHSASFIGRMLGKSRNAVIGKAGRLGLAAKDPRRRGPLRHAYPSDRAKSGGAVVDEPKRD